MNVSSYKSFWCTCMVKKGCFRSQSVVEGPNTPYYLIRYQSCKKDRRHSFQGDNLQPSLHLYYPIRQVPSYHLLIGWNLLISPTYKTVPFYQIPSYLRDSFQILISYDKERNMSSNYYEPRTYDMQFTLFVTLKFLFMQYPGRVFLKDRINSSDF